MNLHVCLHKDISENVSPKTCEFVVASVPGLELVGLHVGKDVNSEVSDGKESLGKLWPLPNFDSTATRYPASSISRQPHVCDNLLRNGTQRGSHDAGKELS